MHTQAAIKFHRFQLPLDSLVFFSTNSTFGTLCDGLKLKVAALNFGSRFQFLNTTVNWGALSMSRVVITSLRTRGRLPS